MARTATLLTCTQAAESLGIKPDKLRRMAQSGQIIPVRGGTPKARYQFKLSDVNRLARRIGRNSNIPS